MAKKPTQQNSLKTALIGVRLDADTYASLEDFEHCTNVEKVTLARASLMAALDYWRDHRTMQFPLVIVPTADLPDRLNNIPIRYARTGPPSDTGRLNEPPSST